MNKENFKISAYLGLCTTMIASGFFIFSQVTLTKIGFIFLGIGFPFLKRKTARPLSANIHRADLLFILLVIASGTTFIVAKDGGIFMSRFVSLCMCMILYFFVRWLCTGNQFLIRAFFYSVIVAALVSCSLGFFQAMTGHGYVPGIEARSIMTDGRFRANGLFDDPNYFGFLLTISWPLIGFLTNNRTLARTVYCVQFIAIFLTLSRATLLIALLQVLILLMWSKKNKIITIAQIALIATPTLLLAVNFNIFGVADRLSTLQPLISSISGSDDLSLENSAAERLDLFFAGWDMFLDYPLMGVGFGNFEIYSEEYMTFFPRPVVAHNTYLTVAAESGLIGLTLIFAFYTSLASNVKKTGNRFLFTSLIGLFLSNFFLVAHYFPIAYLYIAVIASYVASYRSTGKVSHASNSHR